MIVFILAALALILAVSLIFAVLRINEMQEDECYEVDQDHAKCIAAVMQVVSDEFAARVLDQAALDYDAPEGQTQMKVLARLKHQAGGPSMPSIWMSDRANRIRKIEELSHD